MDNTARVWDVDTFNAFLEAAKESPYLSMYKLAALTGMRRGELCGLKWEMVDLDAGHLRVTKTLQHIDGQGLVEGQLGRLEVPLGDPHLANLGPGAGKPKELLFTQLLLAEGGEVLHRLVADIL